jgi:hypothetical protein
MITATFLVRKEDLLAMSMRYYANSSAMRRLRILIQTGVPLAMVLVVALSYLTQPEYAEFVAPLLVVGVLWAGFYPRLHERLLLRGGDRRLSLPEYQKIYGVHTLSLSEKGISSSSPVGEGTYYWPSVSSISLSSDYLFVFVAAARGFVIPRTQVPEATIQEMKAFAERMMKTGATAAPDPSARATEEARH